MPNPGETLIVTGVTEYRHPLDSGIIQIADSPHVWPPYSAFHLAQDTFSVALDIVRHNGRHRPIVADIGTGSGILAILAKQNIPSAICIATDLNPEAVRLARYNWGLNNLPETDLTAMTADGINIELTSLLRSQGNVDVLIANLPQQPLVDGENLAELRNANAAAWNIDPSRDPDGVGIFMAVLSKAHEVMRPGGVALVSASSKQNKPRIVSFLNALKQQGELQRWQLVTATKFDVPASYDRRLIEHWLAMEAKDGVPRLFSGPNGPQYDHYNIVIHY